MLLFLACPHALADEQSHSDANLVYVNRGGIWAEGKFGGHLRVRKFEVGSSHHIHKVVIDWVHVPSDGVSARKVIKSKVVLPFSDTWRVGYPSFKRIDDKIFINFAAMQAYDPTQSVDYSIEVKGLGEVSISSKKLVAKN